jgi:DNA-binding NarL/FixJ family response regulator
VAVLHGIRESCVHCGLCELMVARSGRSGMLYLSVNTVKTHMHHLYCKLGVHHRHEAVERARALGLLAPAPRRPGTAAAP